MTEVELLADIKVQNPEITEVGTPAKMEKEHTSLPDVRYMFVLALSVDANGISNRHKIAYYVRETWNRTDPENPIKLSEQAFYKDRKPAPLPTKPTALEQLETGIKALPGYIVHKITVFDLDSKYAEFELVKETAANQAQKVLMAAKKVNGNPIKFWEFV